LKIRRKYWQANPEKRAKLMDEMERFALREGETKVASRFRKMASAWRKFAALGKF
jgi:hypothetical protein